MSADSAVVAVVGSFAVGSFAAFHGAFVVVVVVTVLEPCPFDRTWVGRTVDYAVVVVVGQK